MERKRLFFAMEVIAPWPESLPKGKILLEKDRHLTLIFLGETDFLHLETLFPAFPKPPFSTGLSGVFTRPLFLPPRSPRVAAWEVEWLEGERELVSFREEMFQWLKKSGISTKEGPFLPHVTLARSPVSMRDWEKAFYALPLFTRHIHLYESLGEGRYEICWTYPLLAPFEEEDHVADLAFIIRGSDFQTLFLHAELALSFHFPPLVASFSKESVHTLDEGIAALNRLIGRVDKEGGCPFKAVSYCGYAEQKGAFLEWEMIVDV